MLKNLLKHLKPYLSNVYIRGLLVFLATAITDWVWARYVGGIASQASLVAANWSVLVIVLGAFVVVSYVNDKRLILPAAIGAWIGTYIGV